MIQIDICPVTHGGFGAGNRIGKGDLGVAEEPADSEYCRVCRAAAVKGQVQHDFFNGTVFAFDFLMRFNDLGNRIVREFVFLDELVVIRVVLGVVLG